MTYEPDETLRKRFAALAGRSTAKIAEALSDVDLEVVTRELMATCMVRTDTSQLYFLPFAVRQTLYGDDAIGDWMLRYDSDGRSTITPAVDGVAVDGHLRWERWEDVVRLLNNDVQPMSLFYSLRCVALGADGFMRNGQKWAAVTNFPDLPEEERFGWIVAHVRSAVDDRDRMQEIVARFTFDRILFARANLIAHTMADLGAGQVLAGTAVRWKVKGRDTAAQCDFDADGGYRVQMLQQVSGDGDGPESGVTILFASDWDFLLAAGGAIQLPAQLTQGTARLVGSEESLAKYNAATRRMYGAGAASQ